MLDLNKVTNIVFEGIDFSDYPDFCDAYPVSADYGNVPMTEQQLEELRDQDSCWLYDQLWDYVVGNVEAHSE